MELPDEILLWAILRISSWLRPGIYVDSEHGQEGKNAQVLDLGFLNHLNVTGINIVSLSVAWVVLSQDVGEVPFVTSSSKVVHELCKMVQMEFNGALFLQALVQGQGE